VAGLYTVTYSCTDSIGSERKDFRTVTVKGRCPPFTSAAVPNIHPTRSCLEASLAGQLVEVDRRCGTIAIEQDLLEQTTILGCVTAVNNARGQYFLLGQGGNVGKCKKVRTTSELCPEGFALDAGFDFYKVIEDLNIPHGQRCTLKCAEGFEPSVDSVLCSTENVAQYLPTFRDTDTGAAVGCGALPCAEPLVANVKFDGDSHPLPCKRSEGEGQWRGKVKDKSRCVPNCEAGYIASERRLLLCYNSFWTQSEVIKTKRVRSSRWSIWAFRLFFEGTLIITRLLHSMHDSQYLLIVSIRQTVA